MTLQIRNDQKMEVTTLPTNQPPGQDSQNRTIIPIPGHDLSESSLDSMVTTLENCNTLTELKHAMGTVVRTAGRILIDQRNFNQFNATLHTQHQRDISVLDKKNLELEERATKAKQEVEELGKKLEASQDQILENTDKILKLNQEIEDKQMTALGMGIVGVGLKLTGIF